MTTLRQKALASSGAVAGMLALPAAYVTLQMYGPSSRVQFFEYLPLAGAANCAFAAMLGTWLGAGASRFLTRRAAWSIARVAAGCILGCALGFAAIVMAVLLGVARRGVNEIAFLVCLVTLPLGAAWLGGAVFFKETEPAADPRRLARFQMMAAAGALLWLLIPQLRASPKGGTVAERAAWARDHVRQYSSLTRTIAGIPVVVQDVGRVIEIAPTSADKHIAAQTMEGVGMNFNLEVVGEKGSGLFRVFCTVEGDTVFEWQSGTWTFHGISTEVATVPNLFRPSPS